MNERRTSCSQIRATSDVPAGVEKAPARLAMGLPAFVGAPEVRQDGQAIARRPAALIPRGWSEWHRIERTEFSEAAPWAS
jgi:hypothetical protein